ncbi:MAG: hypothetical protein AABX03_01370 [Nanoarchaeota archaeon]
MVNNKRGQIGDGLTWVVAMFIIFFIILLFLGGVAFLLPDANNNKLGVSLTKAVNLDESRGFYDEKFIDLSKEKPVILDNLLLKIDNDLSNWAENDNSDVNDLLKVYSNNIAESGLNEPYFYVKTGNKKLAIEKKSDGSFDLVESPDEYVFGQNTENIPSYILKNKFFGVSNNGTLIMIIFYDKEVARNGGYD